MRIQRLIPSALALTLVLAGCTAKVSIGDESPSPDGTSGSDSGSQTYSGNGVSFTYPAGWEQTESTPPTAQSEAPVWEVSLALDELGAIIVDEYNLSQSVTAETIESQTADLTASIQSLVEQAGGTMNAGPTASTMAGLPSLQYHVTVQTPSGDTVNSRLELAFDGTTEYFVNCQYTDANEADVNSACDEVVSSFTVT